MEINEMFKDWRRFIVSNKDINYFTVNSRIEGMLQKEIDDRIGVGESHKLTQECDCIIQISKTREHIVPIVLHDHKTRSSNTKFIKELLGGNL